MLTSFFFFFKSLLYSIFLIEETIFLGVNYCWNAIRLNDRQVNEIVFKRQLKWTFYRF